MGLRIKVTGNRYDISGTLSFTAKGREKESTRTYQVTDYGYIQNGRLVCTPEMRRNAYFGLRLRRIDGGTTVYDTDMKRAYSACVEAVRKAI